MLGRHRDTETQSKSGTEPIGKESPAEHKNNEFNQKKKFKGRKNY